MRDLIVGLASLFPALGMVPSAGVTAGEDDKEAVIRVLNDYYIAFSKLDVQEILPFFHEPSFLVGPGGVAATSTHAALTAILTPTMQGLRARGYGRSELSMLRVKPLSATTTLASGIAVRYKADGQELERVGVTYLLHKADGGWKIAVLVAHDTDKALFE
ncbi:MAG TPA: nuclear transport factor 2 family protein [Candidatus Binatia bacterium]|nr:nuclear transport factor 2 family protein [Candidatus Binatia bacterium]